MRIVKEYGIRKSEILDAAQGLFFELGYENTPVSAIIDAIGVSKGTFYYYFDSKEDLLDQLTSRFAAELEERLDAFINDDSLPALAKLDRLFSEASSLKVARRELMMTLMRVLYRDDNILLRRKMLQNTLRRTLPLVERIITQGCREGVFDTPSPEEAAEVIMTIGIGLNERLVQLILELPEKPDNRHLAVRKLEFYEHTMERILGAPPGSIHVVDPDIITTFADNGATVSGNRCGESPSEP